MSRSEVLVSVDLRKSSSKADTSKRPFNAKSEVERPIKIVKDAANPKMQKEKSS